MDAIFKIKANITNWNILIYKLIINIFKNKQQKRLINIMKLNNKEIALIIKNNG